MKRGSEQENEQASVDEKFNEYFDNFRNSRLALKPSLWQPRTSSISTTDISITDTACIAEEKSGARCRVLPVAKETRLNEGNDYEEGAPLTPAVFHILLVLASGERHGYAIMQETAALTGGALCLGPGTLYGTLKRLLAAGLVAESEEREVERRRYYRLTERGDRLVRQEARRLETLVAVAKQKRLLTSEEGAR